MALGPAVQDVTCVHCRKKFRAEILAPDSKEAGYKCPHCRLYMPVERASPATTRTPRS